MESRHPSKAPFSSLLEKISLLWLPLDSLRILNDNCLTSRIVHDRLPDEPPQLVVGIVALRIWQDWISQGIHPFLFQPLRLRAKIYVPMLDGTLYAELILPYVKRLCMTIMTTAVWDVLVCMWSRSARIQKITSLIDISMMVHGSVGI